MTRLQARHFLFPLMALMLVLGACGGTKVYTVDKTVVYRDNIYNLGNVQRVTTRSEALLPNGDTVNLRGKEKKDIQALLDQHDSFIMTVAFELDSQELIYQRSRITKYSEYSTVSRRFSRAQSDLTKFMGDKKKTQLKLK